MSKIKILESIVYVISELIIFGGRDIAQGGGESFDKILGNFQEFKISPKLQHF